eukprot:Gb_17491 [translate_table: standard]
MGDSEDRSPVSVDRHIRSIVARGKRRMKARISMKSFQKLDQALAPVYHSLNDLEAKITKRIDDATWNHNKRIKELKQGLQGNQWKLVFNNLRTTYFQEIKVAVQQEGDMQRQQSEDLHSALKDIKSTIQTMASAKPKTCTHCSSEKKYSKHSVKESTRRTSSSSAKEVDNGFAKQSFQECKDSIKPGKNVKQLTSDGVHEKLFQKHHLRDLGQMPCCNFSCSDVHSHSIDDNVVVKVQSIRQPFPITSKTREPCSGEKRENPDINKPCIDNNEVCGILHILPQEEALGGNVCLLGTTQESYFLKNNLEKCLSMTTDEQDFKKCENVSKCGIQSIKEVSPRIRNPNTYSFQIGGSLANITDCNKQNTKCNRMGIELSRVERNYKEFNATDLPKAYEGINQVNKNGILGRETWEDRNWENSWGNRYSNCLASKDESLNLDESKKQTSNKVKNTNAFGEHQARMKERKTQLDATQIPTNDKRNPAGKRVKSRAPLLRRPSNRFSESEVECLIAAVEKFGVGGWRDIKEMYFSTFQHHTAADLKDKWRSLLLSAMHWADDQSFRATVPGELLRRVHTAHANDRQ